MRLSMPASRQILWYERTLCATNRQECRFAQRQLPAGRGPRTARVKSLGSVSVVATDRAQGALLHQQKSALEFGRQLRFQLALVGRKLADAIGELVRSHGVFVMAPAEACLAERCGLGLAGAVVA